MAHGIPPGYTSFCGAVEPRPDVAGYAARGQVCHGKCQQDGCTRRLRLDPDALVKLGLGPLPMRRIKEWHHCNRPTGCALSFWEDEPAIALQLQHFVGMPSTRIRLKCRGRDCKFHRVYLAEAVIKGLVARKAGDGRTTIKALGALMTSGCPLCRKTNWEADVLAPDTDTGGWRTAGPERYFDRYNVGGER